MCIVKILFSVNGLSVSEKMGVFELVFTVSSLQNQKNLAFSSRNNRKFGIKVLSSVTDLAL
jgi:hypothetical protein